MSEHPNLQELQAWVAGTLPSPQSDAVELHLEGCDSCARQLDELEPTDERFAGNLRKLLDGDDGADVVPSQAARPTTEVAGSIIGPYKLLQPLGEGGMGTVWMAQQMVPVQRTVALKIIKAGMDTKEVIGRFEAERQALAMMEHPNIAKVLDAGSTNTGRPYFVMELVRGIPITQYCDKNRLSTDERLRIFCDVCNAIQHAHRKGIIHRDIKPTNVLIALDGDKPIVKVIDFGLAKATNLRLTEKTFFTAYGQMVGTPAYMSPEQAEMTGLDVDTRSDVYSLGVVLYELLTGVTPLDEVRIREAGFVEIQRIIQEDDPPTPSTRLSSLQGDSSQVAERRSTDPSGLAHQLRGDLDVIVMKSLEKDRNRRYESPHELAADIARYLTQEPIVARPASVGYRFSRTYRRHKLAFWSAGLIAFALLAGTIASSLMAIRALKAEQLANDNLLIAINEKQKTSEALMALEAEQAKTEVALVASDQARKEAEEVSDLLIGLFRSPDPELDGSSVTVLQMLDHAVEDLHNSDVQPETRHRLLATLARTYESLGLYRPSLPLHEAVYKYWLESAGPQAPPTIQAAIGLANSYDNNGDSKRAKALNEELYRQLNEKHGESHALTLTVMNNLGNGLPSDSPERLALRKKTYQLAVDLLGPKDANTLIYWDNLAIALWEQGSEQDAIAMREEVLAAKREVLGDTHPRTLFTIRGLLLYYRRLRMHEAELPLAEENLTNSKNILGPKHRYTMVAMGRLAGALEHVGHIDESLKLREQALELREEVFGPLSKEHVYNARTLLIRYGVYGRHDRAAAYGIEHCRQATEKYGEFDRTTLVAKNSLAFALVVTPGADAEQLELAENMARSIVKSAPSEADFQNTLGLVLYRREKYDDAIETLEKAIAIRSGANDPTDQSILAMCHFQQGDMAAAEHHLEVAESEFEAGVNSARPDLNTLRTEARELLNNSRDQVEHASRQER